MIENAINNSNVINSNASQPKEIVMSSPVESIERFADLLVKSELVSQAECNRLLACYKQDYAPNASTGDSITSWTTYLISEGVLTSWQCSKIRNSQFKGFFLNDYKILDFCRREEFCNIYLAQHVQTGKISEISLKDRLQEDVGE